MNCAFSPNSNKVSRLALLSLVLGAPAVAQVSLVAHYRLDETVGTMALDASGNGNHGTYMGAVTLGQAGAPAGLGAAVDFDGISGFVRIPASPTLDALLSDCTAAAWINADVNGLMRVFGNLRPNGPGSGGSWSFGLTPTGLRITTIDVQDFNQAAPYSASTWHHVAVVFDAAFDAHFYLDGAFLGTVLGGQAANAPSPFYAIGVLDTMAAIVAQQEWFDGRIADVQVYSGSATGAQIMGLFSSPGTVIGGGALGMSYCTPANNNSTGGPATITATGSIVAANNNVRLTASGLAMNQFGFFLNSPTQGFVPLPGGSQGNLCLGGAIGRYNAAGQILNSGTTGVITLLLDLPNTPRPSGPVAIVAGQTWNFQGWYRDLNPAPISNFTNAVTLLFQ